LFGATRYSRLAPKIIPTAPVTDAAVPPTSNHIVLSVGEPVKKREMSELSEFDALTPNTINTIPPTRSASETKNILPIVLLPKKSKTVSSLAGFFHGSLGLVDDLRNRDLRFADDTKTKKADVPEHPKVFQHVGLLINQPPGMAGLPLV
jgi:hypothetical protein